MWTACWGFAHLNAARLSGAALKRSAPSLNIVVDMEIQ